MFDDFFFGDQVVTCWFDFVEDLLNQMLIAIDLVYFWYPLADALLRLILSQLAICHHIVFFEPLIDLIIQSLIGQRELVLLSSTAEAAVDLGLDGAC